MSPWLVEGGHRVQLLPFNQASQHVSRLVSSSVNAPPTRLLAIATRMLSIVPEDNDTVMQWRTVREIFQFVQRVCCGWTLSPAMWDVHIYNKQVTRGSSDPRKGNARPAAASMHHISCCAIGQQHSYDATHIGVLVFRGCNVACQKALAGSQLV